MKSLAVSLCLAALALPAAAQQAEMSPEQMEAMMERQMQMMVPMFGNMTRALMNAQFEVLAEPETAKRLAAYTRNYYEALREQGFSEDQALEIAKTVGVPSAPMMGR